MTYQYTPIMQTVPFGLGDTTLCQNRIQAMHYLYDTHFEACAAFVHIVQSNTYNSYRYNYYDTASRELLSLQYKLTSAVRAQSR